MLASIVVILSLWFSRCHRRCWPQRLVLGAEQVSGLHGASEDSVFVEEVGVGLHDSDLQHCALWMKRHLLTAATSRLPDVVLLEDGF